MVEEESLKNVIGIAYVSKKDVLAIGLSDIKKLKTKYFLNKLQVLLEDSLEILTDTGDDEQDVAYPVLILLDNYNENIGSAEISFIENTDYIRIDFDIIAKNISEGTGASLLTSDVPKIISESDISTISKYAEDLVSEEKGEVKLVYAQLDKIS